MDARVFVGIATAAVVGMSIATGVAIRKTHEDPRLMREKFRFVKSLILATSLIAWPLIFGVASRWNTKGKISFATVFAFLWPIFLIGSDLMVAASASRGDDATESGRRSSIFNHANIVVTGSWSAAALLAVFSVSKKGYNEDAAKIILLSVLLAISFQIPGTYCDQRSRSYAAVSFATAQRSVLNYAIGIFILGIGVAWNNA